MLVRVAQDLTVDLYEVIATDTSNSSGKRIGRRRIPVEITTVRPDAPYAFWVTNRDHDAYTFVDIDRRASALVAGEQRQRRVQIIKPKTGVA